MHFRDCSACPSELNVIKKGECGAWRYTNPYNPKRPVSETTKKAIPCLGPGFWPRQELCLKLALEVVKSILLWSSNLFARWFYIGFWSCIFCYCHPVRCSAIWHKTGFCFVLPLWMVQIQIWPHPVPHFWGQGTFFDFIRKLISRTVQLLYAILKFGSSEGQKWP